jgi:DNA-binding transcriptional ArsR family regulator
MSHKLNQIFSALADPTRRDILMMLLEDDMAVTDIADPLICHSPLSQSI